MRQTGPLLPGETVLPDEYPVYCGYLYVADGTAVSSDIRGTAADLKNYLNARELRRCDFVQRMKDESQ